VGTAPKPPKPPPSIKVDVGDLVLDRYRVVEQIASGGHSVVFRGNDERLSRPVCIKVFSGLGGSKSGVGRTSYEHFVQEAFALSRLTHPNTLRIYDFGHLGTKDSADGMPLQVCEFMNGGTLSMIVREQGVQSIGETSRVIGAMCAALSEAHGLGIVHRDIKPQNILFGSVGSSKLPKLADFGIAKWTVDDDFAQEDLKRAEDTAIVAGQKLAMYSPSWAAPEQLAGQPVSGVTDIYSLAVVAIYMLSGKAIFADEDVYAGYKKRRHADALVKEALTPYEIPNRAIELLSKALAFDPKQRITSVDDFARELAAGASDPKPDKAASKAFASAPTAQLTAPTVPREAATPVAGTSVDEARRTAALPAPPAAKPAAGPSYVPPSTSTPAKEPWMASAPSPGNTIHRLALSETPQQVGDRCIHFVHAPTGVSDLAGTAGRVRVTYLSSPTHARLIHVKGMSCFVAHVGGRPSPAVTLEQPGDVALVTPRAQEIGHIRVATGVPETGALVFPIGTDRVAIGGEDCTDPILFDFGPGSDAYFVYTQGRSIPKPQPVRRR
jgi:eukaryotic-like serine/threonine-protein kinase